MFISTSYANLSSDLERNTLRPVVGSKILFYKMHFCEEVAHY